MEMILKLSAREALDTINAGLVTPLLEMCAGSNAETGKTTQVEKPSAAPAQIPAVDCPSLPPAVEAPGTLAASLTPTVVPTEVHTYSQDDLARAAGQLMDQGRQADILALLKQFNVSSLAFLPKEGYGAFATALRGLGAKI